MRKHSTARSSRRAPALKDSDYDHEINLIDHAAEAVLAEPQPPSTAAALSPQRTDNALTTSETVETTKGETLYPHTITPSTTEDSQPGPSATQGQARSSSPGAKATRGRTSSVGVSVKSMKSKRLSKKSSLRMSTESGIVIPRVEINEPTPLTQTGHLAVTDQPSGGSSPETAIDILYENQRGGFLCGIPLFSPKALGQLDPPAWTNVAHKPSPTDIYNAQVPDPSWVWVWPEWHVNKDEGVDEEGWEYSFMFAKAFSWHPPRWYSSFVRRRAWTRKRVRQEIEINDPHMLNADYFTVRASLESARTGSGTSSRHSGTSISLSSWALEKPDIQDIETLMAVLSRARIDREKIEAVENFLEHGEEELEHLEHKMHAIMAIFIFQASRRALLTKLHKLHESTLEEIEENDTGRLQRRCNNLKAAIRHADEEVQTLEYWSDVRRLIKEGDTGTATDKCKGWDESWSGADNSGPAMPDPSKCDL